jgi:hypothetical protein
MRHMRTSFTPIAEIEFCKAEIDLMIECSIKHYDAACRQAGAEGGFLYGMKNRYSLIQSIIEEVPTGSPQICTHRLKPGQLDTLTKIVEVGQYLPEQEKKIHASCLGYALRMVLISLNDNVPAPIEHSS